MSRRHLCSQRHAWRSLRRSRERTRRTPRSLVDIREILIGKDSARFLACPTAATLREDELRCVVDIQLTSGIDEHLFLDSANDAYRFVQAMSVLRLYRGCTADVYFQSSTRASRTLPGRRFSVRRTFQSVHAFLPSFLRISSTF